MYIFKLAKYFIVHFIETDIIIKIALTKLNE